MKLLIRLNLAVGILLMLAMIAFRRFESPFLMLAGMALLPAFGALLFANLVGVFVMWKQHRLRSLLPLATYGVMAAVWSWGTPVASRVVLAGTPCYPESFLIEETRQDLELIAADLLGESFKSICTYPSKPTEVSMIAGQSPKELPPGISDRLRRYGFQRTYVDDSLSLVVFSHYRLRTWYDYLYSPNDLLPLYSRPVSFSTVDIGNWSELIRIIKQGPHATDAERKRIVFYPDIVYDYLRGKLGEGTLDELRAYASAMQITPEQRDVVLTALNEQRQVSSRLVEHPMITFVDSDPGMFPLRLGEQKISNGFWISSLIKELLEKGTLVYADDGRNLRIKRDISPEESRAVEWVHVGLMDFLYGNLINKREHCYSEVLGDGWYFNRW